MNNDLEHERQTCSALRCKWRMHQKDKRTGEFGAEDLEEAIYKEVNGLWKIRRLTFTSWNTETPNAPVAY